MREPFASPRTLNPGLSPWLARSRSMNRGARRLQSCQTAKALSLAEFRNAQNRPYARTLRQGKNGGDTVQLRKRQSKPKEKVRRFLSSLFLRHNRRLRNRKQVHCNEWCPLRALSHFPHAPASPNATTSLPFAHGAAKLPRLDDRFASMDSVVPLLKWKLIE